MEPFSEPELEPRSQSVPHSVLSNSLSNSIQSLKSSLIVLLIPHAFLFFPFPVHPRCPFRDQEYFLE